MTAATVVPNIVQLRLLQERNTLLLQCVDLVELVHRGRGVVRRLLLLLLQQLLLGRVMVNVAGR